MTRDLRPSCPAETTKTITIVVNGDSKKKADETFYLDLFGNSSDCSKSAIPSSVFLVTR